MGHPSCQQAVQQCRKASCTLAWNLNITTSLHSVTSSSSVESSVSDVTSSSSVEISVHYIFGLSESSRMRSALQGKHGKHGKAKQSGSPISGEQAVQHLLSVNVCEETNVCGTFLAEICFKVSVPMVNDSKHHRSGALPNHGFVRTESIHRSLYDGSAVSFQSYACVPSCTHAIWSLRH